MKISNPVWNFFSSVKLALFTLGCLAVTSILGTIIPQKEAADFYVKLYGNKTAQFLELFDIDEMYTSWWFLALLGLLAANLIICSIDRLPTVWHQITNDNLALPLQRIEKNRLSASITTSGDSSASAATLQHLLAKNGWKTHLRQRDEALLLFSEKMPWSRAGVYVVHLSILVIFAGAIYGQLTGFKASIMLPELQSSSVAYPFDRNKSGSTIDLGFEIRCERFDIEFYSNNMPKDYRSKLTVLENGKEIKQKDIEVNDPLHYKGITFYQSSYQGYRDFIFSIAEEDGKENVFTGDYQKELIWDEKDIHFGIINLETVQDRVINLKIWFNDNKGEPSQFWIKPGEKVQIKRPDAKYLFSVKQRYATGLQVAKDPGVWVVYLGCGLMLLGLYIAFFTSHRRIWVIIRRSDQKTVIDIKGSANKNKSGFSNTFQELVDVVENNI